LEQKIFVIGWQTNWRVAGAKGERASERRETDAALAERMVGEALAKAHWREIELATQPKGHHVKVKIARQLRGQTPMSHQWTADRLRMRSVSYVSNLLASLIVSSDPNSTPNKGALTAGCGG
jgi:hypothetical protein